MSATKRHEVSGRRCVEPMEPTRVHDLLLALLGLLSCQPYLVAPFLIRRSAYRAVRL
jgi:hypothetical protein